MPTPAELRRKLGALSDKMNAAIDDKAAFAAAEREYGETTEALERATKAQSVAATLAQPVGSDVPLGGPLAGVESRGAHDAPASARRTCHPGCGGEGRTRRRGVCVGRA